MGRGLIGGLIRGFVNPYPGVPAGLLPRLRPRPFGGGDFVPPYVGTGNRLGFPIRFTVRNRIPSGAAINLRAAGSQCQLFGVFLGYFISGMARRSGRIVRGVREYLPAVSGRMRASVRVENIGINGMPVISIEVIYNWVDFGAHSRRSRERARDEARRYARDAEDAIDRYLRSGEFIGLSNSAAREAARRCERRIGG